MTHDYYHTSLALFILMAIILTMTAGCGKKFAVMTKDNIQMSLTLGKDDADCFIKIATTSTQEMKNLLLELYFSAYDPLTEEFFYERYTYRLHNLSRKIAQIPLTNFIQIADIKHGRTGGSTLYYVQFTSLCKISIYQVASFTDNEPANCDTIARLDWILCPKGPDKEYYNYRLGTWTFPERY